MKNHLVSVRFSPEDLKCLDRLVKLYARQTPGQRVTRGDAIRRAVQTACGSSTR